MKIFFMVSFNSFKKVFGIATSYGSEFWNLIMSFIFKNFFLLILSIFLTNYEGAFSACATYCSWLCKWLSYCFSCKHKPHYVFSCFVLMPCFLEHPGCFPLCCSCYASICDGCCHILCKRQAFFFCFVGVRFCLLTLEFHSRALLFVMCTSRKFPLLPDESFFKDLYGCGVFCLCDFFGFFNMLNFWIK